MTENLPNKTNQNLISNPSNTYFLPTHKEGEDTWNWAKMLATAPFYQKLGVGGVAAIILTARELRLPPMACLNGLLYSVDGKITMSGQLMNTMIANAGHEAKILHLDKHKCVIAFKRNSETQAQVYTFTMDDAKEAKLAHKDNWVKYPRDMLFNRCISAGARKYMPEVIGPYYTHDEIRQDYSPSPAEITTQDVRCEQAIYEDITKQNETNIPPQPANVQSKPNELVDTPLPSDPKITQEQLDILLEHMKKADEKCRENMWGFLTNVHGMTARCEMNIPKKAFNACMQGLINNIELNKNKQAVA